MSSLHRACSEIPTLTAATLDLHTRVTEFLRDTRQNATTAAQISVLGSPVRPSLQVRPSCVPAS